VTNQFEYDNTDNVEIEALCRALQLSIDVAYLNGVRGDAVDFIKFRHDLNPDATPVVLLYRYVFYLNNP
jgi:ubiquitin thioesterase protein OTUB1